MNDEKSPTEKKLPVPGDEIDVGYSGKSGKEVAEYWIKQYLDENRRLTKDIYP